MRRRRRQRGRGSCCSLSASLPEDAQQGCCANSVALVKQSRDPFCDFVESMQLMLRDGGVAADWAELEELLYCFLCVNSEEMHCTITAAFAHVVRGMISSSLSS